MAKAINRLSARFVQATTQPGKHADGGGLYLSIAKSPDGARRRWIFLYDCRGRRREMGIGSASTVSLAEARRKAEAVRRLVADGIDPLAQRKAEEAEARIPIFGEMADRHLEVMEAGWRNSKHRDQWRMTLGRVRDDNGKLTKKGYCISLRDIPVSEVTTEDVLAVLKPIWSTKPETASRVRGRIEAVLDAAKAAGFRSGENPAGWKGHLALLLPKAKKLSRGHHPAMAYGDVPAFIEKLRNASGVGVLALEFLILTAARSGEVRGARWNEIDMKGKVWTVSAARMKAGREHRVPLTDRALAILRTAALLRRQIDGDDALVFPGTRHGISLSDMTLTAAMKRLGAGAFTAHGFRSAFRDWAGDMTTYPRELAEQALAHTVGGVEGAYRRSDALEKRKAMMMDWATFCEPKAENITPFPQRSRAASL